MVKRIWRYSHFLLAVSSSIFVLLASITGLFLAFEPIENQLRDFKVKGIEEIPLNHVIDTMKSTYEEVVEIMVTPEGFVKASVFSMEEDLSGDIYINPYNGQKIGDIPAKRPLFEFMTTLHRSLFLKTTGRILVGIVSFLLFLIAITGTILFIKRQNGIQNVFKRITKDDFYQFYHVILGRWTLLPILIISLSGVYLSLLRFDLVPEGEPVAIQTSSVNGSNSMSGVLETIKLGDIESLEFPFSSDEEDYFILTLPDKKLSINQVTGAIVETNQFPVTKSVARVSFNLHTGTGSILWSLVLAISSANILFFLYSGFAISIKRLSKKIKNRYKPNEAEIIILVGSENGSTKSFGQIFYSALLNQKQKVYWEELDSYQNFPNMTDLVILTSTYGEGDPPANATQFFSKFLENPPTRKFNLAVVGFGSLAYPKYCQYAKDVNALINKNVNCESGRPICLIHNKSYTNFQTWASSWGNHKGVSIELPAQLSSQKKKSHTFSVKSKTLVNDDFNETFTLELESPKKQFSSGDLIGILPPDSNIERWYSIAKLNKRRILLSVKRHEMGVCSNYLRNLETGDALHAIFRVNKDFHFPRKANNVILVANGTGIAPYLGMLFDNKRSIPVSLFWGGRNNTSFTLYKKWIESAKSQGLLTDFKIAYSKEDAPFRYVQDLIRHEGSYFAHSLEKGGTIMICGSISMQNEVLAILETITQDYNGRNFSDFLQKGQILMDCY